MAIEIRCGCGKALRTRDEFAGKRVRCPSCQNVLVVPPALEKPVEAPTPRTSSAALQPSQEDDAASFLLAQDAPQAAARSSPIEPARTPEPARLTPAQASHSKEEDPDEGSGSYGLAEEPRDPQTQTPEEDAPDTEERRPRRKKRARPAAAASPPGSPIREYAYCLLVLALVPLVFSLLRKDEDDTRERFLRTLQNAPPDVQARIERIVEAKEGDINQLFAALPGGRIEGAHLPRATWRHWLYAVVAAAAFFGLIVLLFAHRTAPPLDLLLVGLFTATIGILFLLAVQYIALWTQGTWVRGRSVVVVIFYVLKFIGFSYRSALDPDSNFVLSFLGFTCGVGLCEELCKALPLLWHFRRSGGMSWRAACLWGLATGVGFGVSEGITYSADFYNGIHAGGIYVVRFLSCVALHAMWSAAVGIVLYHRQALIQGDLEWTEFTLALLRVLAIPMVLHGLYDTLLKKDLSGWALLVALASFAWLAWLIESSRGEEPEAPALESAGA